MDDFQVTGLITILSLVGLAIYGIHKVVEIYSKELEVQKNGNNNKQKHRKN